MLERIISDVLVRVLGSYVDNLNQESIRFGIWNGDLELRDLRLRPEALAVLFENLGLDLPVTVTAGHIGLLRIEVPWKTLRSAPVRIFMHDLTVVASPVSDGDQSALEERDQRLKAARLATDEVLRDAKFSVQSLKESNSNANLNEENQAATDYEGGNAVSRWGWKFTSRFVTKIIDNIQLDVENVIIQYEDASSVRDCPYTASLAFDSLQACSTDHLWKPVFIESPSSPVVHKVVSMRGLVLNWEPGNCNDKIKSWILDPSSDRTPGKWSGFVREGLRHAIRPLDGELRIALTKSSAIASALSGKDQSLEYLKNLPRVQLDLHFPDVKLSLDDFQYHTLLSTIMYLSDIDRKVRPKSAKERWFWALERLLPKFRQRRKAALMFNADGLRKRRLTREEYCKARNAVVTAHRNGTPEPAEEASVVAALETELSFADIVLFRDVADVQLYNDLKRNAVAPVTTGIWSYFSRQTVFPTESLNLIAPESTDTTYSSGRHQQEEGLFDEVEEEGEDARVPNFRMAFLLGSGSIELKSGGHVASPNPISSLDFKELRLGITSQPSGGLLVEALLGNFEVVDLRKQMKVMYPRAPWAGKASQGMDDSSSVISGTSSFLEGNRKLPSQVSADSPGETHFVTNPTSQSSERTSSGALLPSVVLHSYPYEISEAIAEIRGEYGAGSQVDLHAHSQPYANSSLDPPFFPPLATESAQSNKTNENHTNLSVVPSTPLKYVAALRLSNEKTPEGDWVKGRTRMTMDLAIGGMEVLVDGPRGGFISSITFWHPKEKLPSIMQFLTRAAAPGLAYLRMNLQEAASEQSEPMRMNILVRAPRFILPGGLESGVSLLLDLGTFAMETVTGPPRTVQLGNQLNHPQMESEPSVSNSVSIRHTDYQIAATDLGLYVVGKEGREAAERIIEPFSVHLSLKILHSSSFVEAITLPFGSVDISKVKLVAQLPSLRTSFSHNAFRHILGIVKTWGDNSRSQTRLSGIEPNKALRTLSVAEDLEQTRSTVQTKEVFCHDSVKMISPLVSFEMALDFQDVELELCDSQSRKIVIVTTSGTKVNLKQRQISLELDFRLTTFSVEDGRKASDSLYQRLAFAGFERESPVPRSQETEAGISSNSVKEKAFISLSYRANRVNNEQFLGVRVLSLHLVCVRETYYALAEFFYFKKSRVQLSEPEGISIGEQTCMTLRDEALRGNADSGKTQKKGSIEYSDPFSALGMTTSGAARALRDHAGRGMALSKRVLTSGGKFSLRADLDGMDVVLVTAEGPIASFDVSDCTVNVSHDTKGAIKASGDLGGFGIRDLTSEYDLYAEIIRYVRKQESDNRESTEVCDGWTLYIPETGGGDIWFDARLRNIELIFLQRFTMELKDYFSALRENLRPILEMKGGIGEVFEEEADEDVFSILRQSERIRFNIITRDVDVVMPRHSQNPYEALRFFVGTSSITNEDRAAPGYQIGLQLMAEGVNAYVLYEPPTDVDGIASTLGSKNRILRQIRPRCPIEEVFPFSENIRLIAKIDMWRQRRVPEIVFSTDGVPTLKEGEEEMDYDPSIWLPAIRVRMSATDGINARLCEAEYSILYFTFTENISESPDIQFTDIAEGLKSLVFPVVKPVQPIMLNSYKMPPNYQIMCELPVVNSVIMHGGDPRDTSAVLIQTQLRDVVGCFEYGVDYRMTAKVSANVQSLQDMRYSSNMNGISLIAPATTKHTNHSSTSQDHSRLDDSASGTNEISHSMTLSWDRSYGYQSNFMVVLSDLRIIVEPELFRDLGLLTAPGYPYLKSSAPAPEARFNGRLLTVTVSRPEIWLMSKQIPGVSRSFVLRGNFVAKVEWAPVTARNMVDVFARGTRIDLSTTGPFSAAAEEPQRVSSDHKGSENGITTETPILYPSDVSVKFEGRGFNSSRHVKDESAKDSGSNLHVNAESFLVRVDVNDASLILAVASSLINLKPSVLSNRPEHLGQFGDGVDKAKENETKLTVHFALPQSRIMFTDETMGRYIPIMEVRIRNALVRSDVPWLTNAAFEFSMDLFNDEKGWWEPGIETFPLEIAASMGRSGSKVIYLQTDQKIDVNVSPNTVSGASRVTNAVKAAVEELFTHLKRREHSPHDNEVFLESSSLSACAASHKARRPSVAAFSVRNETGLQLTMWLPHDSTVLSLEGNGGELEVDAAAEEALWTAVGSPDASVSDLNKSRKLSLSCFLSLNGYESMSLSAEQTGVKLITFTPDPKVFGGPISKNDNTSLPLTVVWDVSMRDGVPFCCIRSLLQIINRTQVPLEINVTNLMALEQDLSPNVDILTAGSSSKQANTDRASRYVIEAGGRWSIPVDSIDRKVQLRPALFEVVSAIEQNNSHAPDSVQRLGQSHNYDWSNPLHKLTTLRAMARKLSLNSTKTKGQSMNYSMNHSGTPAPVLTCKSSIRGSDFVMCIQPLLGMHCNNDSRDDWVDIEVSAPLVLENLLPRPFFFELASMNPSSSEKSGQIIGGGYIEPSRELHVHGVSQNLANIAIATGFDNAPGGLLENEGETKSAPVSDFQLRLPTLGRVLAKTGTAGVFPVSLEHEQTLTTRRIKFFCKYWIRNRSDTDLYFASRDSLREPHSSSAIFYLRRKPPGSKADKFVCFSGRWLSFRQRQSDEDSWVNVSTEVSEIDKPLIIGFDGLSLLANVRPARGKFQRSLVVTIYNSVWLENRTGSFLEWCQPSAINRNGIALSSKVHQIDPKARVALHWDYKSQKKAVCLRLIESDGSSDWIWSPAVGVEGLEGEFAAKIYRPKRHEQYIARVVVSYLGSGVSTVVVHPEDRSKPPYRIVNRCVSRAIAFRQTGAGNTHPWLVRAGKTTRYSWDDPQAPVKSRSLIVEVLDGLQDPRLNPSGQSSTAGSCESQGMKGVRYPKFELNIDLICDSVPFSQSHRFDPELIVSVEVKGPTKVVTFFDKIIQEEGTFEYDKNYSPTNSIGITPNQISAVPSRKGNLDVEVYINALGISFVESKPTELAYLVATGLHMRLDRLDGQQLLLCEIQDLQLDNQLTRSTWPVVLWSPPASETNTSAQRNSSNNRDRGNMTRKPFFQLTVDGPCPSLNQGIRSYRGVFVALQQLQVAADEDFVLRVWLFVTSLIDSAVGSNKKADEDLSGKDGWETALQVETLSSLSRGSRRDKDALLDRLYVERFELCPLKITVSFASSRTLSAAERIRGFRSLIRTVVAVLGNVENAEFRFNALELEHVFDTISHFRSLITEYYISQGSNQKMVLLASNSLIGNPSQLFDSIAIGTRDFFVEPANAKGSADFIAGIGRGSSSLFTNTVGGLVGSIGSIPRTVAQGLESAVGDKDYLAERESIRGRRARGVSSPAEGLLTGALSFGHGIASGAAGLLKHPMEGAAKEGPSGFIKGLGKGFIGGVLKPITGALDLIAEPAAGIRSIMVSDKHRGLAEPARPPRAFGGMGNDKMVTYDLRLSLGQTILSLINHRNNNSKERLQSWIHLAPVPPTSSDQEIVRLLWENLRRSTRSSRLQPEYLKDARGNPQKVKKIRVGLITNERLIISSLDGNVLQYFLLNDILDTRMSGEPKHRLILNIGVRSGKSNSSNFGTIWNKVHCGTVSSRDELCQSLKKALRSVETVPGGQSSSHPKNTSTPSQQQPLMLKFSRGSSGNSPVEVVDIADLAQTKKLVGNIPEMKCPSLDGSSNDDDNEATHSLKESRKASHKEVYTFSVSQIDLSLDREIAAHLESPSTRDPVAVRSVRIILVNATGDSLSRVHSSLDSGQWTQEPPELLKPNEVCSVEADGTANRALDVSGLFSFSFVSSGDINVISMEDIFVIRFLNPLLADNMFSIYSPSGYTSSRTGFEKGAHGCSVITLKKVRE